MSRLLESRNASALARGVGLHVSALKDAANKGQLPKADKAVKIARALGVSCEWLFDDSIEWPPPRSPETKDLGELQLLELLRAKLEGSVDQVEMMRSLVDDARLQRLDSLAGRPSLAPEEKRELDEGLRDLAMLFHMLNAHDSLMYRISQFPPVEIGIRTGLLQTKVDDCLSRCQHLARALRAFVNSHGDVLTATPKQTGTRADGA